MRKPEQVIAEVYLVMVRCNNRKGGYIITWKGKKLRVHTQNVKVYGTSVMEILSNLNLHEVRQITFQPHQDSPALYNWNTHLV